MAMTVSLCVRISLLFQWDVTLLVTWPGLQLVDSGSYIEPLWNVWGRLSKWIFL